MFASLIVTLLILININKSLPSLFVVVVVEIFYLQHNIS